jgi:hypothetical protein
MVRSTWSQRRPPDLAPTVFSEAECLVLTPTSSRRGDPGTFLSVGLRWESQGLGVTLAFDEAGRQVGRVRRWWDGWEAHYDARGRERPPGRMGSRVDEGHRLGAWGSAAGAQRAVQRHHDRPGAQPQPSR